MKRPTTDSLEINENSNSNPTTIVIVGCGSRGNVYAKFSLHQPDLCKVVGVVEPRKVTRETIAKKYNVPPENVFQDWKDLNTKIADAVVIATQDRQHTDPTIKFAQLGYHILLEKPMAVTEEDCQKIYCVIKENKTIFAVGHVLRYTPFNLKLKALLESDVIGDIINIQHMEPVGNWHFAHSYVRGNWAKESESSSSLLAKSCHDLDVILWLMGKECSKVSSFGSLLHFTKKNQPPTATDRCVTCPVEPSCIYSAKKIYLDRVKEGHTGFPVKILTEEVPNPDNIEDALKTGPYGRCVYDCDNDVNDNQVVNFQFVDGSTASFTMVAFTEEICVRKTKIFGTKGEIEANGENSIKVFDFLSRSSTYYNPRNEVMEGMDGHGGGDFGLMKAFIEAVRTKDTSKMCSPEATLRSYSLVFAAEKARLKNEVVSLSS